MVVDSALDVYGISMGWYVYDILFDIFYVIGLVLFPIASLVISESSQCIRSAMHELNTRSALRTVSVGVISMFLAMQLALYPVVPLEFSDVKYYGRQCNRGDTEGGTITNSVAGEEAEFLTSSMQAQLGGYEIKVPFAYYVSMALGSGIKNWAVEKLPCATGIRMVSNAAQMQAIDDPVLREETADFIKQCYKPALRKYANVNGRGVPDASNWPGARLFVEGQGFYDNSEGDGFYSTKAREGFGGTKNKLPESEGLDSKYGFPNCKEWWNGVGANSPYGNGNALSTRLYNNLSEYLKQNKEEVYRQHKMMLSRVQQSGAPSAETVYLNQKDAVVKEALFTRNKLQDLSSKSTTDYGMQGDTSVTDGLFRLFATVGLAAKSIDWFSGGSMMQLALPMAKPFILMAIMIAICPAIVISGYKWKYIGMFCFVIASVMFWPFFWELARLIDDTFLEAMGIPLHEINTQVLSQWMISGMYLYLPVIFSMCMGWVGLNSAGDTMQNLTSSASSASQKGFDKTKSVGKKAGKFAMDKATSGMASKAKGASNGTKYYY